MEEQLIYLEQYWRRLTMENLAQADSVVCDLCILMCFVFQSMDYQLALYYKRLDWL